MSRRQSPGEKSSSSKPDLTDESTTKKPSATDGDNGGDGEGDGNGDKDEDETKTGGDDDDDANTIKVTLNPRCLRNFRYYRNFGPGPCFGDFERFRYNIVKKSCEPFSWGGCGKGSGEMNNFASLDECQGTCKEGKETCKMPVHGGTMVSRWWTNLRDKELRWYHEKGSCHQFVYSGHGGNLNNFATRSKCMEFCVDDYKPTKIILAGGAKEGKSGDGESGDANKKKKKNSKKPTKRRSNKTQDDKRVKNQHNGSKKP